MVEVVAPARRGAVLALGVAALVAALAGLALGAPSPASARARLPPIRHVFVIVLENEDATATFGPGSKAPYLARTLRARGQFLPNYYGIGHESLDNYVALISGQAPNTATQADCQFYMDVAPGAVAAGGQAVGAGCVYPTAVKTVADQLDARRLRWRGYMQDMGDDLARDRTATCSHPALNSPDKTQKAEAKDQYATRHNPFVYFHSLLDRPACARDDVPLSRLSRDLRSVSGTPNYAFITPNLCNDGHDAPCQDGRPGGLVSANAFLRRWVPRILRSPAYRRDGLLLITFDESSSPGSDSSACCAERPGPSSARPGVIGPGGGRIGAVVLSRFTRPGSTNRTPYNHYAFLRSVEDLFGLSHLGFAGQARLKAFGADVYDARSASSPPPGSGHGKHRRASAAASSAHPSGSPRGGVSAGEGGTVGDGGGDATPWLAVGAGLLGSGGIALGLAAARRRWTG